MTVAVDGCPGCTKLTELLVVAEDANAELGRQLEAAKKLLIRSGQAEIALTNELRKTREEEPESVAVKNILDDWKVKLGHPKAKTPLTGKRAKCVRAMLKHFTEEELREAVTGCMKRPFVTQGGRRPTGTPAERYDDPTLIFRDESTVERFIRYAREDDNPGSPVPAATRPNGPSGVDAILPKLEKVRQVNERQWEARCPAHEDRHSSLHIAQGDKGALIHCKTGCDAGAVMAALGLELGTLFDPQTAAPVTTLKQPDPLPSTADLEGWWQRLGQHTMLLDRLFELRKWSAATLSQLGVGWDGARLVLQVRDANGLLVNVLRYLPKRAEKEPKMLAVRGRPRDLWPAPERAQADDVIWLVEGEPDAISGWSLGLATVAVPGANGWRSGWAPRFAGREVVICMDCDGPGRQLAQRVHADLANVADVRVLDLEPERTDGYDLGDVLLDGMEADQLRVLANAIVTGAQAA